MGESRQFYASAEKEKNVRFFFTLPSLVCMTRIEMRSRERNEDICIIVDFPMASFASRSQTLSSGLAVLVSGATTCQILPAVRLQFHSESKKDTERSMR